MSGPLKLPLAWDDTGGTPVCGLSLSDLETVPSWTEMSIPFGASLEQQGVFAESGDGLRKNSYFWRLGVGQLQSNEIHQTAMIG